MKREAALELVRRHWNGSLEQMDGHRTIQWRETNPAETLVAKHTATEPSPADPWRQWHRLFGLLLTDHLAGSPFTVELEKDLSIKQQLLDVVVIRRGPGEMTRPLPDGLDDLVLNQAKPPLLGGNISGKNSKSSGICCV